MRNHDMYRSCLLVSNACILVFVGATLSLQAADSQSAQDAGKPEDSIEAVKNALGRGPAMELMEEYERQCKGHETTYRNQLKSIQGEFENDLTTLNEQYVEALDRLKTQLVGKLDEVRKAAIVEEKLDDAIKITQAKQYFETLKPTPPDQSRGIRELAAENQELKRELQLLARSDENQTVLPPFHKARDELFRGLVGSAYTWG